MSYVKVAEGCDYKCAFLHHPDAPGAYRSRTARLDRRERAASPNAA